MKIHSLFELLSSIIEAGSVFAANCRLQVVDQGEPVQVDVVLSKVKGDQVYLHCGRELQAGSSVLLYIHSVPGNLLGSGYSPESTQSIESRMIIRDISLLEGDVHGYRVIAQPVGNYRIRGTSGKRKEGLSVNRF